MSELVESGYITERKHPIDDLWIYNYTPKTQFQGYWTPETIKCRGLILDIDGNIVARPLPKIFNHSEHPELTDDVRLDMVHDKIDGSLGIMYWSLGEPAIATRGSFSSHQAQYATEVLQKRYANWTESASIMAREVTYLFEIVYPSNRIVLDNGDLDDLVLLGGVVHSSGRLIPPGHITWPGPAAERYDLPTLGDAKEHLDRPGREGFVARTYYGLMVKIKQPDYLEKHRLVFGLSERRIWERMGEGVAVNDIVEPLPDEWQDWARETAEDLLEQLDSIVAGAMIVYHDVVADLEPDATRKDFAEKAKSHQGWTPYLFALYDGRDIAGIAWKEVKP